MNIIACENCGILFDKNLIKWPDDDGDYDNDNKYRWTGSDLSVFIPCPVCKEPIIKDSVC